MAIVVSLKLLVLISLSLFIIIWFTINPISLFNRTSSLNPISDCPPSSSNTFSPSNRSSIPAPCPPTSIIPIFDKTVNIEGDQRVCFIIRTFYGHKTNIYPLLFSIFARNYPNLRAFLIDTDVTEFTQIKSLIDQFNALLGRNGVRLIYTHKDRVKQYPQINPGGASAYTLTDMALKYVISLPKQGEPSCQYVTFTNGDNIYGSNFIPVALSELVKGNNLVGVHFISRYSLYDHFKPYGCGPLSPGVDREFATSFGVCADLGSVMVSVDFLEKTGITFLSASKVKEGDTGAAANWWVADNTFFEALYSVDKTKGVIVPRVLFLHQ